jgi:hypothetical protein
VVEPVPTPPEPPGPVLGNLQPALGFAWHPVGLSRGLRPGGWLQVRQLGRTWTLRRTGLPLAMHEELHVRADRLGVALRRALCDFAVSAPREGREVA